MAGSINSMGVSPVFFTFRSNLRRRFALATVLALFAGGLALPEASAQRRHTSSPLDTLGGEVSQSEGLEILQAFRRLGVAGDYRLNFELRVMPRREKTRTVSGLLLGTTTQGGPLSRIDIALEPADISESGALIPAKVKRLLLQNGIFANVVEARSGSDEEPQRVGSERYFEPIAGSDFAVFDLLMPFTFWQSFEYEGRTTMRSRPTHVFTLFPPEEDRQIARRVSRVRLHLDEEFNALNRVEIYNAAGEHAKTISVVAFKIVDGQGVLSQVDVRNEKTRDKTRLRVNDAAIGVDPPEWVFTIDGLERNIYGTPLAALPAVEDVGSAPDG